MGRITVPSLVLLVACRSGGPIDDDLDAVIPPTHDDDPDAGPAPGPGSSDDGDDGTPSTDDDDDADDGGGGSAGGGTGSSDDGSDPDEPDGTTTPIEGVLYGDWRLERGSLTDDRCPWFTEGLTALGLTLDPFLPTEFAVFPNTRGFEIEANGYGAVGPIQCVQTDDVFDCDFQTVYPTFGGLGDDGWTYSIVFYGTVVAEDHIEGMAQVSYPSVDAATDAAVAASGLSLDTCAHTFELVLTYAY